jgi:hypothetical protein
VVIKAAAGRQQSGHGVHGRHLERLVEGERRQQSRQPPREHGLAGAGRADEQQVVAAGRGHFERSTSERLSLHVRQVGLVERCRLAMWPHDGPRLHGVIQHVHGLLQ